MTLTRLLRRRDALFRSPSLRRALRCGARDACLSAPAAGAGQPGKSVSTFLLSWAFSPDPLHFPVALSSHRDPRVISLLPRVRSLAPFVAIACLPPGRPSSTASAGGCRPGRRYSGPIFELHCRCGSASLRSRSFCSCCTMPFPCVPLGSGCAGWPPSCQTYYRASRRALTPARGFSPARPVLSQHLIGEGSQAAFVFLQLARSRQIRLSCTPRSRPVLHRVHGSTRTRASSASIPPRTLPGGQVLSRIVPCQPRTASLENRFLLPARDRNTCSRVNRSSPPGNRRLPMIAPVPPPPPVSCSVQKSLQLRTINDTNSDRSAAGNLFHERSRSAFINRLSQESMKIRPRSQNAFLLVGAASAPRKPPNHTAASTLTCSRF